MTAITIRLPDDAHARLKELAKQRKTSMNKLFEEMATITLTEFDAETRFRLRASRGSAKHGLELLETLRERHQKSAKSSKNSGITPTEQAH